VSFSSQFSSGISTVLAHLSSIWTLFLEFEQIEPSAVASRQLSDSPLLIEVDPALPRSVLFALLPIRRVDWNTPGIIPFIQVLRKLKGTL